MKSVQVVKPGLVSLMDMDEPRLKEGCAKIRVKAVGICGTDVLTYLGKNVNVSSYPLVIGHEIAGEIAELNDSESGFSVGDRVVLDPYLYCGHCYPCSQGRTNCCEDLHCLGVHCDGGMSEYFVYPTGMLRRVPADMDWVRAALAEPLVIGLHGVHTCALKPGEHMVIVGAGAIGILAGMAAKAYGGIPILIDPVRERLDMAKGWGFEYVIDPVTEDALGRISEITGGRMAECVMEASGSNAGIRSCLDYAAYTGRIALTGWPKSETSLPTNLITKKELTVRGSRNGVNEFDEAISLIHTGRVDAEKIVSRVVRFEELPAALEDLAQHPGSAMKIIGLL